MNITLKQIRALLAIADHGTFSRAAFALHISQPALTRLVQELASTLDMQLVERGASATRLSEHGAAFYPIAAHFVREMDQSLIDLKLRSQGLRGTVTIAVDTAFSTTVMPSIIRHCQQLHPAIKIILRDDNSAGIVQRVSDGEVDFGIGSLVGALSRLIAIPILHAPLGVIYSPQHYALPAKVALSDLSPFPLIHHGADTSIWQLLNMHETGAVLGERAIAVATKLSSVLSLVNQGIGVAVMSALGASVPQADKLHFRPFSDDLKRSIYLCQRRSAPLTAAAKQVQTLIQTSSSTLSSLKQVRWA